MVIVAQISYKRTAFFLVTGAQKWLEMNQIALMATLVMIRCFPGWSWGACLADQCCASPNHHQENNRYRSSIICLASKMQQGAQTPILDNDRSFSLSSRWQGISQTPKWEALVSELHFPSLKLLCRHSSSPQAFNHCLCAVVLTSVYTNVFFPPRQEENVLPVCDLGK